MIGVVATAVSGRLGSQLDDLLRADQGSRRIASAVSRPSIWRSSADVDEIDVRFEDGTGIDLIAKAADWRSMSPDARRARPSLVRDEERERATYERILSGVDLQRPRYYGSFVNDAGARCLLLERVRGVPLWQCGDHEPWREAARWLARLHRRVDLHAVRSSGASRYLLRYDREFYSTWMRRACMFHPESQLALARLIKPHAQVVEWLIDERAVFIHGEFYASNILVESREHEAAVVVRPLDWEMAAIGPELVDVACLVSGRWSDDQRADVADAYYREVAREGSQVPRREHYLRTLHACLFHVAVQNLGWSNEWTAPPDHAHDWLGDALRLSEEWQ